MSGARQQAARRGLVYEWPDRDAQGGAAARRALRNALDALGLTEGIVDDVELAVAELVANATEHAQGPYELYLHGSADAFICAVRDRDPRIPQLPARSTPSPASSSAGDVCGGMEALILQLAERGRGLRIVDHLFPQTWGFRLLDDGTKIAWIAPPPPERASAAPASGAVSAPFPATTRT